MLAGIGEIKKKKDPNWAIWDENTMFEMTNTLDEINSGLDNTEEKMSEFKEIAIKPIQSETEKDWKN